MRLGLHGFIKMSCEEFHFDGPIAQLVPKGLEQ